VNGFLGAVSFLTRVPTGTGARRPEELAASVPWFPVVGAGVGLAVAAVYAGAGQLLPPLPAASLAVVAGICLTGAFHEDGLGDTADAFGGHHDRDGTVRILKDPRLGTFGVLAVAASLLLRAGAVAALAPAAALAALPAAHALSRAAAVAAMTALPAAGDTGLGASYALALSRRRALAGAAAGLGIALALLGLPALVAAAAAALATLALGRLATRRVGGVTGDVLGAVQQLGEILVLLVAAAATTGNWQSPVSSVLALVSGSP
jgi:adenosylcobinamide-GDP ribazoletransferase